MRVEGRVGTIAGTMSITLSGLAAARTFGSASVERERGGIKISMKKIGKRGREGNTAADGL